MPSLRRITLLTIALLTIVALSGCGSEEDGDGLEEIDADAIAVKLEQVRERADAGRCTGDGSALSSLTSLREFASSGALDYVSEPTREDLQELLERLGEQIQSQCEQASDLTTTTTTDETETETTETETSTTETETSTEKTTTETRETTQTTTRESSPPRPPTGGGPGGGPEPGGTPSPGGGVDSSGGIGPGAIVSPFRSTPRYDRPSVPRSEDDPQRAALGTSR